MNLFRVGTAHHNPLYLGGRCPPYLLWLHRVAAAANDPNPQSPVPVPMTRLAAQIDEATRAIRHQWPQPVQVGIILGTGLGGLAQEIRTEAVLPYASIPHFPRSTTVGHAGQLVCGRLEGVAVVAMEGRFHAYEGYSQEQITFPVRVMKALGAGLLIVSNAGGGLNPHYALGDIMVIEDHINLMNGNPLVGENDDRLGPRFPDMSAPYDPVLIDRSLAIARREDFVAHKGVYVGVTGPNLETRAEYRFLRGIGADVVGHVHGPRGPRGGPRRDAGAGSLDRHRPLPARRAAAGRDQRDPRHRRRAEPKLRKIVLGVLAAEAKGS